MPEEITPQSQPAEQPSQPAPSGIDAMMAQLDSAAASGKPISDPKPVDKPADSKPADKPADKKPETPPAKPADKAPEQKLEKSPDEPDWSKAPPKWYKIYEQHKSKSGETIKGLEAKIKALESKPVEGAGDAKKLETYEKQLDELRGKTTDYEKQIAQLDYTKSAEYKRQYVEPANRVYAEAVGFVQRLKVQDGDETRAATQADFDYIRSLPVDARRKAANELFGEYAADVIDFTRDIDRIKRDATAAVDRHASEHERIALEREGNTKKEAQQYEELYKSSMEGIKENENWGKWFREDENDPEASTLLREGFEQIEKVVAQLDKLPIDQRAAYSAMYLARAAVTPRLLMEVNRITEERDALREELEKIRGTDPGAEGEQAAGGEGDKTKPVGIDGAVAVFDQAPR